MREKGEKDDGGKLPWWLLPLAPIREVLKVLNWAAYDKKPIPYGPHNWQHVEDAEQRYYDAAMRHLTDWWEARQKGGSTADHESGFHQLGHACCCVIFLLWFELNRSATQAKTKEPELCEHCGKPKAEHWGAGHKYPICPDGETQREQPT